MKILLTEDEDIEVKWHQKKRIQDGNTLFKKYPDKAIEWHPTKNGNLTPHNVTSKSAKKVWWQGKCGHEWEMQIKARTVQNQNCPYCCGKRVGEGNSLKDNFPDLVNQWNYNKNIDISPESVTSKSGKKVWWICSRGHEWYALISSRTRGRGCPYCAGKKACSDNSLKSLFPLVADEWNYNKNKDLIPENVTSKSKKKVWWVCSEIHEWEAVIASRTRGDSYGTGCPYCSGRKVTLENSFAIKYPKLFDLEWNYEKNKHLDPYVLAPNSHTEVWWICEACNHEWKSKMYNRTINKSGCPVCYYKSRLGENNPNYNPNLTNEERVSGRKIEGYNEWRNSVLIRDGFTCQCCGDNRGGNLNAHHLDGYNWCTEKRLDVDNGITLCDSCHVDNSDSFHKLYGFGDNTKEQYEEWIFYQIDKVW